MTVGQNGEITEGSYWKMLGATSTPVDLPPEEARRRVGDLLREAVDAHMVSDVPVGAFLSGGIDSSAVVALMREAGHTPRTFSVGFDRRRFRRERARRAHRSSVSHGTHAHSALRIDLLDQLPSVLKAMDQPTGDAVNTYVVAAAVRARGIMVALSGLGGDEVFGGYPSFAASRRSRTLPDCGGNHRTRCDRWRRAPFGRWGDHRFRPARPPR